MAITDEIVIWFSVADDDTEGIMGYLSPQTGGWMPLFASGNGPAEAAIDAMAARIVAESGQPGRKVRFRRAEVVAERNPGDSRRN